MKRLICLIFILTFNFIALTCHSQYRSIRISNVKDLYWQVEIYGGVNLSFVQKNNNNSYAIDGLSVKIKQQIQQNKLYANGGIAIEGNFFSKALLKNNKLASLDYFAIGFPFSAELSTFNNPRMSLYAALGGIPMIALFYNIKDNSISKNNELGFLFTPRVEGGMYITIGDYKLKLGAFAQRYHTIAGKSSFDKIGRAFGGFSLGMVF